MTTDRARGHEVALRPIQARGGYERFRFSCPCGWSLIVIEDDTIHGTPPDAHLQAERHRTGRDTTTRRTP